MVIGYSFRDEHINEIIYAGVQQSLKLFISGISGLGSLEKAPAIRGHALPLIDELKDFIIGGSRRPLLTSITTDQIEHTKIQRFFF